MNRDRQIKKEFENKQAQAREEYAKNKSLYVENKVQEKANDYNPPKNVNKDNENNY